MTYVRNLRFEEKPNYKMLKNLFDEYILELNNGKPIDPDQKFDWYYQRQKILEEKARQEIEEMEKQNIKKQKTKGNVKPPTKKQELINAQKEIFKQQEEARLKQKQNKKKKKIEAMEEQKLSKNSKEFQTIQKE